MRQCECGNKIPWRVTINGKRRLMVTRKKCLECSPFKDKGGTGLKNHAAKLQKNYRCTEGGKKARFKRSCRNYGITVEQFERMLVEQNGVCKICKRSQKRRLNIDHDHITGSVRGLLCHGCNIGIGSFQEKSDILELAALYVKNEGRI